MRKRILIRFGEMMLKGKNLKYFVRRIREHIKNKFKDLSVEYFFLHDRTYLEFEEKDEATIISRLQEIPGIHSFSIVYVTALEISEVVDVAVQLLNAQTPREKTFKIETKRVNKHFPMTSLEVTQTIAPMILSKLDVPRKVVMKQPEETLHVEIRDQNAFIYLKSIKGMGGFPYGMAGKGLMLMSGGIDSPVAAYLAIKQGLEVELLHFESTPLTPLESVQKVYDLAKKLAKYTVNGKIRCHMVPFTKLHEEILKQVYDPYIITVMRRMMYRIADDYAERNKIPVLLNGDSIGQVASQTLNSMVVVDAVSNRPVIRPLATFDKADIINIAKKIDTFTISIRPFNDCCSIYVPRNPVTQPKQHYTKRYEDVFDFDVFVEDAALGVITFEVTPKSELVFTDHGFTVEEVYESISEKGVSQ